MEPKKKLVKKKETSGTETHLGNRLFSATLYRMVLRLIFFGSILTAWLPRP